MPVSPSSSQGSLPSLNLCLSVGVGIAAVGGASYLLYKHWKKDEIPKNWRRVGILQQVHVYPIKSCAPLKMLGNDEVLCDVLGLRIQGIRDRTLMVINGENAMLTARTYPKMLLIKSEMLSPTRLKFTAPGMEQLELDFGTLGEEAPGDYVPTSVWGVELEAMLCGDLYDRWFSRYLLGVESGIRLVHYAYPVPVRATNPRLANQPYINQQDSGTFVDATSYMLMNLASIDDLNRRLKRPVNPLQFRGNFELKMDEPVPYAEDRWQWIRIGDTAIFRVVAPCTRCILPNINPDTAERDPEGEPLKTLKSYRLFNYPSPALGIHMGVREEGCVKVNDVIYVEDK